MLRATSSAEACSSSARAEASCVRSVTVSAAPSTLPMPPRTFSSAERRALREIGLVLRAREQHLRAAGDDAHAVGDGRAAAADAAEEAAEVGARLAEAVGELAHLVIREHARRDVEVALGHLARQLAQLVQRPGDVAREDDRGRAEDGRGQQRHDERVERDLEGDVLVRRPGNGQHEDRAVLQLREAAHVRADERAAVAGADAADGRDLVRRRADRPVRLGRRCPSGR